MSEHNEQNNILLAGAVKRPITPTVKGRTVYIAGYKSGRLATGIHDELWVRALAVRLGHTIIVWVALDLLGLLQDDIAFIHEQLQQNEDPIHLIVTCTRNYAGPDVVGLWTRGAFGSGLNVRYTHFLRQEVVQVVRSAVAAIEPVTAYLARSQVQGLCANNESKELSVLQLRTLDGKTVSTMVNLALVPNVLDETNTLISADFCNWLYLTLERSRKEVTLYVCADADETLFPAVQSHSWEEAERIGRILAKEVQKALSDALPVEIDRLDAWSCPIRIPSDDPVSRWLRHVGALRRHSLVERHTDSQVGLIELGPARMAVLPGLIAPEMGFELRKMLDAPYRFLLCMSNDNLGFIVSPEAALPAADTGSPIEQARRDERTSSYAGTIIRDELDQLLLSRREQRT